ncbi:uncharacterized protein BJ212DRAFT_1302185 [Suillus subaureus]|uniref:Uncharacterized protein n=1 Tax=Suillus subaureus TaxID=48587 RepID=A0A9P7E576_9AGAM|nr:uncharacterized protein BJ212DRAFT_1302185 [Suillus subaureus]KAG1810855.1 hypothetical protein BJ212DRAFT_1302185 [Suillus subaureus]
MHALSLSIASPRFHAHLLHASSIQSPHFQLEPTARDTSEKTGRVLRPTSHRRTREEAIAAFDKAATTVKPGPLFIPVSHNCARNVSEPPHPNLTLFNYTRRPVSPITPSPKDSAKEELSDDFDMINDPRSQLPGAFLNTPQQHISSTLSLLSELTSLSENMPAASTSTPANTHPIHEVLPIKQEEFETLHTPSSIPGGIIVGNLPHKYEPQPSSTPTPITTANQQPIMATLYKMPIHGTNKAPKFNRTMENLVDFINIYKGHANEAGLCGLDCIKGIIRYLPLSKWELWGGLPEVSLSDYKAFIKEVKVMYPSCEGPKYYMLNDLQAVACDHMSKLMPLAKELSNYLRCSQGQEAKKEREALRLLPVPKAQRV